MSAASVTTMLKIHCGPQQQTIYAQKPSLFEVPYAQKPSLFEVPTNQ